MTDPEWYKLCYKMGEPLDMDLLIGMCGGTAQFAKVVNVSQRMVFAYKKRGFIPASLLLEILAHFNREGMEIAIDEIAGAMNYARYDV